MQCKSDLSSGVEWTNNLHPKKTNSIELYSIWWLDLNVQLAIEMVNGPPHYLTLNINAVYTEQNCTINWI